LDLAREHGPVDRIAVAQEVARGGVPRERLHTLLGRPPSGGGVGDVDLDDPSAVMRQDDEDEQDLEQYRGHGEEDRGLRDLEAELLELAVDPGGAPPGGGTSHGADQRADGRGDGWAVGELANVRNSELAKCGNLDRATTRASHAPRPQGAPQPAQEIAGSPVR
jgi:hypothetical protein